MPADAVLPDWLPAYLRAREREGRLLADDLVAVLPDLPGGHPLRREWLARAESSRRLLAYIDGLPRPLAILDAGCGNGWLAAAMAHLTGTVVQGLDANEPELRQAQRVFRDVPNLDFVLGDLSALVASAVSPHLIVLASVIQYVADLPAVLVGLGRVLADGGEIHILDSPLYRAADIPAARERSRRHYAAIGVPEMAAAYHHHTWESLDRFAPTVLYQPVASAGRLLRRLTGRVESPFPWLRIHDENAR